MNVHTFLAAAALAAAMAIGQASAPAQIVVREGAGEAGFVGQWNDSRATFERFIRTVVQLNMTPDFSLDKETKAKLQAVRDAWQKAQQTYFEENKEAYLELQRDLMDAYKAKDEEKVKETNTKLAEFNARGPKPDEALAKAKAALTPEQLKLVEAKIGEEDAAMKARMETMRKWPLTRKSTTQPAEK